MALPLVVGKWGLSLAAVQGLLIEGPSPAAEHGPRRTWASGLAVPGALVLRLGSCGIQASLLGDGGSSRSRDQIPVSCTDSDSLPPRHQEAPWPTFKLGCLFTVELQEFLYILDL